MVKKPLAELVATNGQAAMAAALGCSAAAISKAICPISARMAEFGPASYL